MNYSDNYSLRLPDRGAGDRANVDDINYNSEKIDGLTHGNRTMLGPGWDAETDWMKGDFVVKTDNSTLEADYYECKEDHTTGAWDASKWEHRTVAEVLEALAQGAGGATSLDELDDVEITSPSEGQILGYKANSKWGNVNLPDVDVTKEASGNPVEFSDGANAPLVKCVSAITGSQDLHGYDKPWVGGAGKNKLENTATTTTVNGVTFTVNDDGTVVANGTATSNAYIYVNGNSEKYFGGHILNGSPNDGSTTTYFIEYYDATVQSSVRDYGAGIEIPLSTDGHSCRVVISVRNGYTANNLLFKPMIRLSTETDSTFAPYSNICPITAYTENTISVVGRNIYNPQYNNGADGNYFQFYGLRTAGSSYKDRGTVFQAGRTYRITVDIGTSKQFGVYGARKNSSSQIEISGNTTKKHVSVAFTPEVSDKYVFWLYSSGGWSGYTTDNVTLMIENGETEHEYEPYNPDSNDHTTTFTNSIYQGEVDMVGGSAEADMIVIDLGDLNWTYDSSGQRFYTTDISSLIVASNHYDNTKLKCSCFETSNDPISGDGDASICYVAGNLNRLYARWKAYTSASDFTTAVTGQKMTFDLATPSIEQVSVSNTPIKSLSGYSHIESSTGEMEVEYITEAFSPITELVDSQISALQKMMELMLTSAREATMTASANYTTGTLIVACGALYKATTAISSGASLVVGTNITPTTIAAELAALA